MNPKKIADLKQGDLIYNIDTQTFIVQVYHYFCVHPHRKDGNYHILFDVNHNPIKIFKDNLQEMLDLNIQDYREADFRVANILEKMAHGLRQIWINQENQ